MVVSHWVMTVAGRHEHVRSQLQGIVTLIEQPQRLMTRAMGLTGAPPAVWSPIRWFKRERSSVAEGARSADQMRSRFRFATGG